MQAELRRRLASPFTGAARAAPRGGRGAWRVGYSLCLPAVAVMLGLFAYPISYDVVLSFTGAREFANSGPFVGLANYAALFGNPGFWTGVRYLAMWVPLTVAAEVLVGLATALLLWWKFWGRTLLFLAVFIPWAFPSAFSAFAWYSLIVPPFQAFYTHQAVLFMFWLNDNFGRGTIDFFAYGVMSVWRISSIMAIFLLAGLNTIPRDLLDYARLEARSPFVYLWQAVLPMLRRYLVLVVMVGVVITFIDYDSIYLESGQRTIVPVFGTLAFVHGIMLGDTGYAAALNVVSLPLFLLVAVVGLRWVGLDRQWSPGPAEREQAPPLARLAAPSMRRPGPSPVQRRRVLPWPWRRRLLYAAGGLAAILIAVFHIFPIYSVYNQAVRPVQELALGQPFIVYHPDFSNFHDAVIPGDSPMWLWARNTLIAFGGAIVLGVSVGMLAGYGLARFQPPGAALLAKVAFACFFVPQFAIIVPLYQIYSGVGLDNSLR